MSNEKRQNTLDNLQLVCFFVAAWVLFKLISMVHPSKSILVFLDELGLMFISVFFTVKLAFGASRNLQDRFEENASRMRMILTTMFELGAAVLLCLAISYYYARDDGPGMGVVTDNMAFGIDGE